MAEFEFNLRDIFRILRRRKWIILFSPVLVGLLTYLLSERPPPIYRAESMVKISRVAANMQALLIEALSWYQGDNIATQSQIITSQKIRTRVGLCLSQEHPRFSPLRKLLGDGQVDYEQREEQVRNDPEMLGLVNSIQLTVEKKGGSDIVGIQSTAPSARLAIDTVNCTAQEFVDYTIAERNSQIREAVRFIRSRIAGIEQELTAAEQKVEQFKTEHLDILGLEATDTAGLESDISRLQRQISELDESTEKLKEIKGVEEYFSFAPAFLEAKDPLIIQLEQQLLEQARQVSELRSARRQLLRYQTEQARDVQKNLMQVEELSQRMRETVESLKSRYGSIREDLEERRQLLVGRQSRLAAAPEVVRRLEFFERQVQLKRDALDLFQRRLQDAEIQNAGEIKEVTVVEKAASASMIPQPSRVFKSLIGLLIGTLLGVVFALVLESLDTSIGTIEDVEKYVRIPVLGVIPNLDPASIREHILIDEMGSEVSARDLHRISSLCTHFAPKKPVSEAFRTMRAHLEVLLKKNTWKTLLITSSVLQEGKTNTACNLSVVFAQAGYRTLLVDADLRRPQVHQVFGLSRSPGLAEVLLEVNDWESATRSIDDLILGKLGLKNSHVTPGLEYLFLMTAGRRVDSPAELLNLEKVNDIMAQMREQYDLIVVDTAPVLPVADASQLAPGVDAILLAYQIGRVGREVLNRSKSRLEGVGGNVVGLVMNDIEAEIQFTRDYEYYSYSYREESLAPESPGIMGRVRRGVSSWFGPRQPGSDPAESFRRSLRDRPRPPQKRMVREKTPPSKSGGEEIDDIMNLTDDE